MSEQVMIKVSSDEILDGKPVPYNVFTAGGALLCSEGHKLSIPEQAEILRVQGWRRPLPSESVSDDQDQTMRWHKQVLERFDFWARGDAAETKVPAELNAQLPSRGRPPIIEADVLIADDVGLARRLLAKMLREQGIKNIESVDNGGDAITHFFRSRPHLVFLDIDMPDFNGLEALKQIKQWTPDCFVCMVSGSCTLLNAKQAKTYGVNAFLVKPYSLQNLQRMLRMYGP